MRIQHLEYPFHHTIVYDIFDVDELAMIRTEIERYIDIQVNPNAKDEHHEKLLNTNGTLSFNLDALHATNRSGSSILSLIRKVYDLGAKGLLKDNPFCGYITTSNADNTFVQLYKNGSSYFEHKDGAVLSFLYPFNYADGGELVFTEHKYIPYLTNNCCLIFPSFETHKVTPVITEKSDVVRVSINQRIYIKP